MKKIVLVITGGSVSGALIEVPKTKGELPHILRVTRENAPLGTPYDSTQFLADLPARVSAVATALGTTETSSVHVCLTAPLTLCQVQIVKEETPEPHTVTKSELTQMIKKAGETFVQAHGSLLASLISGEPVSLESLLIGSLINGYFVTDPAGLSARTREFHLYTSVSSRALMDTIKNAVSTAWPRHGDISFSSFPYVAAQAFNLLLPNRDNVIIINVGEDHSEVLMIWNDMIADRSIVTLGINTYLTEVGKALSLDVPNTLSTIRLYAEGGATPEASARITEASRAVRDAWMKAFSLAAGSALEEFFLPDHVVILSDEPSVATALTRTLTNDLSRFSLSDSSFNFLPITDELSTAFIFPEKVTLLPALMLTSLFYARIG